MYINCHCHIFNLQSIYTEELRDILEYRLREAGCSKPFARLLVRIVTRMVEKNEGINLDAGARSKVAELLGHVHDPEVTKGLDEDFIGRVQGLVDPGLGRKKEQDFNDIMNSLHPLAARSKGGLDARLVSLKDVLEFLTVMLARSMDQITDYVIKAHGDGVGIVPLMMDITDGSDENRRLFAKQRDRTQRQVLRYPGRVLPFFAVNPRRSNTRALMLEALYNGFVGVKLYPSLGYELSDAAMTPIFEECDRLGAPVMMHCNNGGFYAREEYKGYSDPRYWWEILGEYKNLRVCFAHFGGGANLAGKEIPSKSWTATILNLMDAFEGRVFADISYHTESMGAREANYFSTLRSMLNGVMGDFGNPEVTAKSVLWGSDATLVQMRVSEDNYWKFFTKRLTKAQFVKLAENNAKRYLGLPSGKASPAQNIQRYVQWCSNNKSRLDWEQIAPWLDDRL